MALLLHVFSKSAKSISQITVNKLTLINPEKGKFKLENFNFRNNLSTGIILYCVCNVATISFNKKHPPIGPVIKKKITRKTNFSNTNAGITLTGMCWQLEVHKATIFRVKLGLEALS